MEKLFIQNLIKEKPNAFRNILQKNNLDFYTQILNFNLDKSFSENLYRWLNDLNTTPICEYCHTGNCTFINIVKGYSKYCCKKCNALKNIKLAIESARSDTAKENRRKSVFDKYGKTNVFELDECKQKIKESLTEKYGVDHPSKSKELLLKRNNNRRKIFFDNILNNKKINNVCKPMFSASEYIDTYRDNKYKFECVKCLKTFEDHIDGGHIPRCVSCYPKDQRSSIAEMEILDFVKSLISDDIITNKRLFDNKEIDIYIPSKKIAIEYNGLYWHSEVCGKRDKKYHLNKTNVCNENGIRLIQIFEDEWLNKRDIVKSKLKSILGVKSNSIYARKVTIKKIDGESCNKFLELTHIQGKCNSPIRYGAYHNSELVGVMTFGKKRLALGSKSITGEFELIRFSTSNFVVGLASKILKCFIQEYNPSNIISYSDNRWSDKDNSMYKKIGFKKISETNPNYYYLKHGYYNRLYRYNFAKHTLANKLTSFDINLSEWENMQLNGYDRIWDCGSCRWELKLK